MKKGVYLFMDHVRDDIYRQRFHTDDFFMLVDTEIFERSRLSSLRIRIVDHQYSIIRINGQIKFCLDLFFKSLIDQSMTAEKLFNYNT